MPKPWKERPPMPSSEAKTPTEPPVPNEESAMLAAEIGEAPEIDLHGDSVDLALSRLDTFVHQELMRGSEAVKIIHGRGTGKLRDAVLAWLRKNPNLVAAFRDASAPGQQGGMTVAALHRL